VTTPAEVAVSLDTEMPLPSPANTTAQLKRAIDAAAGAQAHRPTTTRPPPGQRDPWPGRNWYRTCSPDHLATQLKQSIDAAYDDLVDVE